MRRTSALVALACAVLATGCKNPDKADAVRDKGDKGQASLGEASSASEEAGPTTSADPPPSKWHPITRDGKFEVAICAFGKRPKVGDMFSPEHSSTRDPVVAESVPCPPPEPALAAPAPGTAVLAAVDAEPFIGDHNANGTTSRSAPVFVLAKVSTLGPDTSEVVTADGRSHQVRNAYLIALPDSPTARVGDLVLAHYDEADLGVMRAIVIEGGSATEPRVRRLSGFDSGAFGERTLSAGSFRIIDEDGAPGSLVAVPLFDRVELAMVLHRTEDSFVAMTDRGTVRTLLHSSVTPLPIRLYPKKGQTIYVPWSGSNDLSSAKAAGNHEASGHVAAVIDSFPDSEPDWYGVGSISAVDLSLGMYTTIDL